MERWERTRILMVDDEPRNLQALEAVLGGQGYDLIRAQSGEEALRHVLTHEFALILLDVRMPGLDGYQTARLIRQRRRSYHTPIMFLTGNSAEEMHMFLGYEAGAVDFMVKPLVPEVLRSKVAVFVDLFRKNAEVQRQKAQLKQAAEASKKRFYDLVQGLDAIVWEADAVDHRFTFVSQQAEAMLEYPVTHWLEDKNFRSRLIHQDDLAHGMAFYRDAVDFSEGREVIFRALTASNRVVWVRDNVRVVRDEAGRPLQLRGVMVDITDHKKAEQRLAQLAHYDALTGLPNRLLLESRLNAMISSPARYQGKLAAVFFFDLDRFKLINDTYGHNAGDAILKTVAERVRHCVREHDIIARLGGDEFIAIVDDLQCRDEAANVAEKILAALAQPIIMESGQFFVTSSIGISFFPEDGRDAENLLRKADMAMYCAKQDGRNTYEFYTSGMSTVEDGRRAMEHDLRQALANEEFFLVYQPKVNTHSGQLSGFEALLRWHRKGKSLVSPETFVPLLEDTDLITAVGEWVLRQVCEQLNAWGAQGYQVPQIAVNLSARQLKYGLPNMVRKVVKETHADPALLELEVTESVVMHDMDRSTAVLRELRDMGVSVALDDFGTGHSSLGCLKYLPIETIKIDKSFIAGIPAGEDAGIVKAIIAMAANLRLRTVAEGVETKDQLAFLDAEGCGECQGSLIGRAMSAQEAADFMAAAGSSAKRRRGMSLSLPSA